MSHVRAISHGNNGAACRAPARGRACGPAPSPGARQGEQGGHSCPPARLTHTHKRGLHISLPGKSNSNFMLGLA